MTVRVVRHGLPALFLALASLLPDQAPAKILLVPNEYPTIRQAVEAAAPNDTVRVAAGVYRENINLRNGVMLEGSWNSSFSERNLATHASTIDGSTRGGYVVFAADKAVLDGFIITGGSPPPIAPEADVGAGIYCNAATFSVRNNAIAGNNAAGIYSMACKLDVANNVIAANGKAGIYLEENSSAVIRGNLIYENRMAGVNAGGTEPSKVEIVGNTFHDNKKAGINVAFATGVIANNLIYRNGQAGVRCGVAPMLVINNTLTENELAGISVADSSSAEQGGKVAPNSLPVIKNNIVANNGAAGIRSFGAGYSYNLVYGNNKAEGFYPDFLWYVRLQFGGYEDQASLEKTKNIVADPLFVAPAKHDYRLRPGSPAIDAGDPDLRFNDLNFGPSLGSDVNDIGAYGGPRTVLQKRSSNASPTARISSLLGQSYVGDKILLSGKESLDPDGDEIRHEWRLVGKPMQSMSTLMQKKDGTCEFSPDQPGSYTVLLAVADRWGMRSNSAMTTLNVDPDRPPTAKISKQNNQVNVGDSVVLSAYDKNKQNGSELTYFWTLTRKPDSSSAALRDNRVERPSFTPDVPGCYSVQLLVGNGKKYSEPDISHVCTRQTSVPGKRRVPDEYPTIQTALDAAEPGDNIFVQPGVYKENIIIDKAVNLIGIGRPVVDGGGRGTDEATIFVCYLDTTATGRIEGFAVTGGGGGLYGHGIQILNSSPEIVDNHIKGNKHVGVGIHGQKNFTRNTQIHNNLIYDNAVGVSNGLGASGQIHDNAIYGNKAAGIGVRGLATPVLRNNNIYDNYIGIGVREEAYPLIEDNDIHGNRLGIAVNPGTNDSIQAEKNKIVVRNNRVRDNKQCGIFISSLNQSDVFIQGNAVSGNSGDLEARRKGGVLTGYPHEAFAQVLLKMNTVSGNNGQDVEQYGELGDSAGTTGNSENHRPKLRK